MNIEFAGTSKMAAQAQELAWVFKAANDQYATDYPAAVGNRMTNTDSAPFQDLVALDQPARGRARSQVGSRLGPALAPAHGRVRDVFATRTSGLA